MNRFDPNNFTFSLKNIKFEMEGGVLFIDGVEWEEEAALEMYVIVRAWAEIEADSDDPQ